MIADGFDPSDELSHPYPTDVPAWNESWLLSFCDDEAGTAGFFRIGLLPNQERAWLWLFLYVDGAWLAIEELHLPHAAISCDRGVEYDRMGLSFAYLPTEPFASAEFRAIGVARVLSGSPPAGLVPIELDLAVVATGPCFDTGLRAHTSDATGAPQEFSVRRFEQPVRLDGAIRVGSDRRDFTGLGQRDRSWGPRIWRAFTLGDLHAPDLQLWFAGGLDVGAGGIGYTVRNHELFEPLDLAGSSATYLPNGRLESATLELAEPEREPVSVDLELIGPPLSFQIAHSTAGHVHNDYFRALVRGHRSDGGPPMVGWYEANRLIGA